LPTASLPFDLTGKTVYDAGHRGMVGSAPLRKLGAENVELVTASRSEADLRDQARWFAANHVGAVTSPLQIGITAYGIPPDGVPSRDSYPAGTRNGASSTYHAQLDPGYLHSVISVRSFTSLSRWDRLSRVG
jgi:hypothetical protein